MHAATAKRADVAVVTRGKASASPTIDATMSQAASSGAPTANRRRK
jgi:hypothetical protein